MEQVYKTSFDMYCPCSRETYKKLKRIRMLLCLADGRARKWERWDRKLPKNRTYRKGPMKGKLVPEPVLFGKFHELSPRQHYSSDNISNDQFTHYVLHTDLCSMFLKDYENARKPIASPELVKPLMMQVDWINQLLSELETWWLTQRLA